MSVCDPTFYDEVTQANTEELELLLRQTIVLFNQVPNMSKNNIIYHRTHIRAYIQNLYNQCYAYKDYAPELFDAFYMSCGYVRALANKSTTQHGIAMTYEHLSMLIMHAARFKLAVSPLIYVEPVPELDIDEEVEKTKYQENLRKVHDMYMWIHEITRQGDVVIDALAQIEDSKRKTQLPP